MKKVEAFFVEPFQGALTLFLLDLGMVAASGFPSCGRWAFASSSSAWASPSSTGPWGCTWASLWASG